ncbi:GDSL-type esterase/lipase family protein [Sporosarcina sp. G11-34]|uniref:GDSL-type esterase/lipase family protein n=1 Tax=Sporosarcina sp. G11-34 TaxID=2849605 RepID=UPI0022A8E42C|nr:GDSL-type esterase/lipase family protein [Sporosarcina sp. G11-34]
MRRVLIIIFTFSFLLSGCNSPFVRSADTVTKREFIAFEEWSIPNYFIPKRLRVVGLGDSLTQGVGDELKWEGYFGRLTNEMNEWKGVKDVKADNLAKRGRRSDQLIKQLEDAEIQAVVKSADVILITIGGNDIMRIVKKNLFDLRVGLFYDELKKFENRLDELYGVIRDLNGDAIIGLSGLYNPFTIVTDEANDFENIIEDWNEAIEVRTVLDQKSCFVPVTDLFNSNAMMVYHTDFFHPNAKGYDSMTKRFQEKFAQCDLKTKSDGQLDM